MSTLRTTRTLSRHIYFRQGVGVERLINAKTKAKSTPGQGDGRYSRSGLSSSLLQRIKRAGVYSTDMENDADDKFQVKLASVWLRRRSIDRTGSDCLGKAGFCADASLA